MVCLFTVRFDRDDYPNSALTRHTILPCFRQLTVGIIIKKYNVTTSLLQIHTGLPCILRTVDESLTVWRQQQLRGKNSNNNLVSAYWRIAYLSKSWDTTSRRWVGRTSLIAAGCRWLGGGDGDPVTAPEECKHCWRSRQINLLQVWRKPDNLMEEPKDEGRLPLSAESFEIVPQNSVIVPSRIIILSYYCY